MAKPTVSKDFLHHLSATSTMMHDAATVYCDDMKRGITSLKKQISKARTSHDLIYSNPLTGLHESVEATNRLNTLSRLMEGAHFDPAAFARAMMDVYELGSWDFKEVHSVGTDRPGQAGENNVSINHLLETHKKDFQQVIKDCIRQSSATTRTELRDRFNRLFTPKPQTPGGLGS